MVDIVDAEARSLFILANRANIYIRAHIRAIDELRVCYRVELIGIFHLYSHRFPLRLLQNGWRFVMILLE